MAIAIETNKNTLIKCSKTQSRLNTAGLSGHWFLRIQPKKGEETSVNEISIFDKAIGVEYSVDFILQESV